jgi:hypothetical protein
MQTITCACEHCDAETGASYIEDEYCDTLRPDELDWNLVEGHWYCPSCAEYVIDPDTEGPICCACQRPNLDWQVYKPRLFIHTSRKEEQ